MNYLIEKLAKGGLGLCHSEGKTWFVENALPGESGESQILENKSKYGRCRAISRQNDSPCRNPDDACILSSQGKCDGCGFRHVKPELALNLKSQAIFESITHATHCADIPYTCLDLNTPSLDHTRRRVRIHIDNGKTGYYQRNSHIIISASQCTILEDPLRCAVSWLEHNLKPNPAWRLDVQMDLDCNDHVFAHFKTIHPHTDRRNSKPSPSAFSPEKTWKSLDLWAKDALSKGIFDGIRLDNDIFYGSHFIKDEIETQSGLKTISYRQIGDFGQATRNANIQIHELVEEFVKSYSPHTVTDLFAGSGNLSFRAACFAPIVDAYEFFCSKQAFLQGTQENQKIWPKDTQVSLHLCDLSKGLPTKATQSDLIICDPARDGLSEIMAADLCHAKAKAILYVSCEASCLARDLTRLSAAYQPQKLTFIDMFPQTPHAEVVTLLTRIR